MSYQVIARKWRPQNFSELVGQEHIATTLINALKQGRLHQALIFTGPRGTGKTSTARILAKMLRCPNAVNYEPCGKCPSCLDISSDPDVIEIDGASNNSVDDVRELRQTISTMPFTGKTKVLIIDEVHMLSTSAFNALLKTLEEPPPHVVFILATTEVQKLPETILSRCPRFDFRRIPTRQIAAQLEKICLAENIKFTSDSLWLLARQADGSMRDSQSLLDQVVNFCGDDGLSLITVSEILGLTDRTVLLETLRALVLRDQTATIEVLQKLSVAGYEPKIFAQDLLEEIRHTLLVRLAGEHAPVLVDLPDSEIQALQDLGRDLPDEELHLLFDMALKGVNDLLRAQDPRLVLEMLLLRMAVAPKVTALSELLNQAHTVQPSHEPPAHAPSASQRPARAAPPSQSAGQSIGQARTTAGSPPPLAALRPEHNAPKAPTASNTPGSLQHASVASKQIQPQVPPQAQTAPAAITPWEKLVENIKRANSFLGSMLEQTHLLSQDEKTLVIGVPKKADMFFDLLKNADNTQRLQNFIKTFWNVDVAIQYKKAEASAGSITPKALAEKQERTRTQTIENQVEQNPLVRSAQNIFKSQIKSIKERP